MMRVLFVTRKHPPTVGGMERLSYEMTSGVSRVVDATTFAMRKRQIHLVYWMPVTTIRTVFHLWRHARSKPYDIVHFGDCVWAPVAWLVKKLCNVKVAITAHGLDLVYPNPLFQRFNVPFVGKLDQVICISSGAKEVAIQKGVPDSRCVTIPVGIHASAFVRTPITDERAHLLERAFRAHGIEAWRDRFHMVTVGRLEKRKGIEWFLENVLPELPDHVLYSIVGDGKRRPAVEEWMRAHPEERHKVAYHGKVDEPLLKCLLHAAHVFVMPNIAVEGDYEGFGIAAIEGAAAGCVVVAAAIEGVRDAVQDGKNGFLVESGNAEQFAAKIRELAGDAAASNAFGVAAARFTADTYDWTGIIDQYRRAFQELASPAQPERLNRP